MHVNEGGTKARLIRSAQKIRNQEELDRVLSQVEPGMGRAWLEQMRPYFRFVPLQFQVEAEKTKSVDDCAAVLE